MHRPTLLTQFSVVSLALFIGMGALLGWSLTNYFEQQALRQQELAVSSLITPVVGPYLTDGTVLRNGAYPPPANASPEEKSSSVYNEIDRALSYIGGSGLVRIKIWNREGMVVYSDDPKLVGMRPGIDSDLRAALDGKSVSDLTSLDKVENVEERGFGRLLEVYLPLKLPSYGDNYSQANNPVVGAIEGYYDVTDLEARVQQTNNFLLAGIFTGFLFLYVSLFTIVRNASQRLLKQSSENRALLADTERKAARLALVNELARSITRSSLDLDEVFNTALSGIDRIVEHAGSSIVLLDEQSGEPLRIVHSTLPGHEEVTLQEIAAERALIEHATAFISGDTRLTNNPTLHSLAEKGVFSLLLLTISLGERRLGLLRVVSGSPDCFNEGDASILKGVADQLAVATENTRLIEEATETAALRETNRLKDEFVSLVSHELRTPLASIKGYSHTLLNGGADWDEQTRHEFMQIIAEESDKLQDLVENLLEMSRIEAGRLPVDPEPVLLHRFCRDVVARITSHYPDIEFRCELNEGLPVVEADPRRVEQVLVNLLQNAAKYSGAGHVTVRGCYDGGGEVTLMVEDNGAGIAPEHLPHLFTKFYRAVPSTSDGNSGTGLGLAIARALVEAQGGRIWVESTPGEGTTFCFTLPTVALGEGERNDAYAKI